MLKLKLGVISDDKPVKLIVEIPAAAHRDLLAYAEVLGRETGHPVTAPARLVAPMLIRFMATDRAFGKMRRMGQPQPTDERPTRFGTSQKIKDP